MAPREFEIWLGDVWSILETSGNYFSWLFVRLPDLILSILLLLLPKWLVSWYSWRLFSKTLVLSEYMVGAAAERWASFELRLGLRQGFEPVLSADFARFTLGFF